jgi:hypothetical protein
MEERFENNKVSKKWKTKRFQKKVGKFLKVKIWENFWTITKLYLLGVLKMYRPLSESMSRRLLCQE